MIDRCSALSPRPVLRTRTLPPRSCGEKSSDCGTQGSNQNWAGATFYRACNYASNGGDRFFTAGKAELDNEKAHFREGITRRL